MKKSIKKLMILSGFLLFACAHQGPSEDMAHQSKAKSLIDDHAKINTDLYFEIFNYKPFALNKSTGVCLQVADLKGKDWKSLLETVNHCAEQNQWLSVETIGYELLKTNVNSPWGAYYLSLAAEYNRDLPRALWMVDLAIKKASSQMAILQFQRGRVLWLLDQKSQAIKEFTLSAKLDKNIFDANLFLAEISYHDLEYKTAAQKFKEVLAVDSNNLRSLIDGAECAIADSDPLLASQYLEKAVALKPEALQPRVRLAQVYEEMQKQPQLAVNTYRALKEALSKGLVRERPVIDINEKIKVLEASLQKDAKPKRSAAAIIK
jgi:tetratricopeptide (TPR) repeat protein